MAGALLDHDLVQRPLRGERGAVAGSRGERQPLLDPGRARQHRADQRRAASAGSTSVRNPSRPTFTPSTGQPSPTAA